MKEISILFYDDKAVELLQNPLYQSGGATKQVLAWSKGLQSIGVNTILMGATANTTHLKRFTNIIISFNPNKGIRILRYFYYRFPLIIMGIFRSKADYIYYGVPGEESGLIAIVSKILRKKFILRVSNDHFADDRYKIKTDSIRYFFFLTGFRLADYILCQNDYQYEKMSQKYPQKTFKLVNPYAGKLNKKTIPFEKKKQIAWVGTIQYQKNISLLLKIAKTLPDIPFKIAGNISSKLDKDSQIALGELRNLPNVNFLGFLKKEDVLKLLENSYILLNTSHHEGFSNTYLEAFSVSTPVFSLEHNDPNNIIAANKLGEVYKNADDFAIKFTKLIKNHENFDLMSKNCINYMKDNHNLIKQSNEFLKIITDNKL